MVESVEFSTRRQEKRCFWQSDDAVLDYTLWEQIREIVLVRDMSGLVFESLGELMK